MEFSEEISKHDLRIERCKRHEGRTIAFITAVLSGFRDCEEISEYGKFKKSLMEEYLSLLDGIPSDDTFRRFFSVIRHPRNNNDRCTLMDRPNGTNWVVRQCVTVGEALYLGKLHREWPWIKSFEVVVSERAKDGGSVREERYFITSLKMDAKLFLKTSRRHWGIENGLHWRLDMDFQEDKSRKRENAALNFSIINKMAISVLNCDKKKEPMVRKRQRAALNDEYLKSLLKNLETVL